MNVPSRREKVEAMLAKDPHDQFLRYTLAMECEKAGEHERSLELFRGLMRDANPHVPSYLMAAQSLNGQGRLDEARAVLREGIEIARRDENAHAAGEMSELLASIGSSNE